jgi:hypothetical protein
MGVDINRATNKENEVEARLSRKPAREGTNLPDLWNYLPNEKFLSSASAMPINISVLLKITTPL